MPSIIFNTLLMSVWIPFAYSQSTISATTGLVPVSAVVASVAASRSSAVATTSASATTSAAAKPTLLIDTINTLTACGTTELHWDVTGLDLSLYDISMVAIDVNAANAARSSSAATVSLTSSAVTSSASVSLSSAAIASSSTALIATSVRLSSASASSLSTALVGRALHARQSQTGNLTIATNHDAQEPITFTVTLPPGRYYIAGWLSNNPRTAANSNIFNVVAGNDLSCLSAASATTSTPSTATTAGGTAQSSGSASTVKSSSMSGGAIAGIVIGVIGGLAILGFLAFFCLKRRRRQNRGIHENRFSNIPSASSHDGGEYGHRDQGRSPPIGAAWRRDSDPDEKYEGSPARPYANRSETNDSETPSLGDRRRQAGQPTSHTLTEKKSTQGFIGKSDSNESSAAHSRSNSVGGGPGEKLVGRSTSTRRKPVPSLGPELRGELERERKMSAGGGGVPVPKRKSYSLAPDLPLQQSHS